ncbi:putative Rho-type GTPase-activating protein 4 [Schistosoma japonicum]|nr:putative Rho-type GTPase-activating protein 4 [Schistosoma japonicum]
MILSLLLYFKLNIVYLFYKQNKCYFVFFIFKFYRITDYLKELYTAESWLENLLSSDVIQSRSHSPLRQPTDYRSRRARIENNTMNSNKILKRTCSEQRYDENQLIGGLWDRREMDLVQKLIRRAISIIELKMSSRQTDNSEAYSAMSAIVFRNSSNERKLVPYRRKSTLACIEAYCNRFPISIRSFIPESEKVTDNNNNNNSEITSWKKIYAEEIVNVVKLPRYPIEQHLNLETIHQSQTSTIFLCSDYLVLTQWPLDSQSFVCTGDLAHIIPLCEVWCDIVKLDELFVRSSAPSKSVNHKYSPSEKFVKHSEIENDHLKCNISSSSGISTASLEDGDLNSPSIDHYSQTVDAELMKTPGSCSSNDNHLSSSDTGQLLLIGRPLMENWAIRFPNNDLCVKWKQMINESIRRNQQLFDGKSINVKVINQIIPNHQLVYKYHNIPIHMTVDQLKEKALEGLNINGSNTNAELYLRYTESNGDEREILLYGPEYPFLIALYSVQMNTTTSALNTTNTLTTNSNINRTTRNNSPDDNNHNKDMLDFIRKAVASPSQSEMKTTDHDWIISRDQIKVSFVLRPVDKCSTDNNQQQHQPYQNQQISKTEMMKSTEYIKQERGRSTSKVRGRRSETRNHMTKSTLFLDSNNNNNNSNNNNNVTKYTTNVPLRAAISASSLQFGTTQEVKCGQIFGRLPEQCWPDCRLPESLVNLFAIIYYNGVNVEGIFRRTAVHSQIELMRARVDENIQSITPNNCNPILASCVLKRFFCEIPGHLLIDSNWDEWARLTEINSASERLQVIERLIRSLPKVNQTLLALLIYLLAHIRDHEDINRMSARNLAVVWGPNLIQRSNSPLALIDSKISTQIVTYLLEPSVTNFLLNNTSNVKNELNQHFSNIWGNFLKDSNKSKMINSDNSMPTTSIHSNIISGKNIPVLISNSITDSSEGDESPKHDSNVVHTEHIKTDGKLKQFTQRGHYVSSM